MSGEEIRQRIKTNNKELEAIDSGLFSTFVLNPRAAALIAENQQLQSICKHKFREGKCKYCGLEEQYADKII